MTSPTENQQAQQAQPSSRQWQIASVCHKLTIKAIHANSKKNLTFIFLNDTIRLIRYKRAFLWDLQTSKPHLLGISNAAKFDKNSSLVQEINKLIKNTPLPNDPEYLEFKEFKNSEEWVKYSEKEKCQILWVPIPINNKPGLGLWLEVPKIHESIELPKDLEAPLKEYLIPGYSAAWCRFISPFSFKKKGLKTSIFSLIFLMALFLSFMIQVPLRVVSPCEIVPESPTYITAPLNGIIDHILVKPGDLIKKDTPLFVYDKQVPLQNLEIAKKKVQIIQAEYNRASTLGINDPKFQVQLAVLKLQIEKENISLEIAQYQAGKLLTKSPIEGVTIFNSPEKWRGKPVQVGERVMVISDPTSTKIKLWIPEGDNIILNKNAEVSIFLNIRPEKSYPSTLKYIANESSLNDLSLPSFVAEATWNEKPENIKLGLKGTAIIYGEKVPLFYFLLRKPWTTLRMFFGF